MNDALQPVIEALDACWRAAFAEGAEGRAQDAPDDRASQAVEAIMKAVRDYAAHEAAQTLDRCARQCETQAAAYRLFEKKLPTLKHKADALYAIAEELRSPPPVPQKRQGPH